MKLYYLPGACSMTPHTALEWIGRPYEAQAMSHEDTKQPDYLALNPLGTVPLLVDGDFSLTQNVAIVLYLDSLHPQARLFGSDTPQGRARALRWLVFLNSDVHTSFSPLFHTPDYITDEAAKQALEQSAHRKILRQLALAGQQLATQDYLADDISVADVYLYVLLRWCQRIGLNYGSLPQLAPFYRRMGQNPGLQAVLAQEGLEA